MNAFSFQPTHGYSLPSPNGADALPVLKQLTKRDDIAPFQNTLQLWPLKERMIKRVVLVVGSGMNPTHDGMSDPSRSRAEKALELHWENSEWTLIVPTARFTYRLLDFFSKQPNPASTDAREIGKYLVQSGIPPEDILLEEWSNCTFGNAVFSRLLLDAFLTPEARLTVVTSDWALERAEMVFRLLFPERDLEFATVSGDISPELAETRRKQEGLVNNLLYRPSIRHYSLDSAHRLIMWLWYLRHINASTPWNNPDEFTLRLQREMAKLALDTWASYGVVRREKT